VFFNGIRSALGVFQSNPIGLSVLWRLVNGAFRRDSTSPEVLQRDLTARCRFSNNILTDIEVFGEFWFDVGFLWNFNLFMFRLEHIHVHVFFFISPSLWCVRSKLFQLHGEH
jgi:hypothetical protein